MSTHTLAAAAADHRLAAPIMLVTTAHPNFAEHTAPGSSDVHPMLGRLIQPRHYSSIEATGAAGIPWAADNDCFQGLDPHAYTAMLDRIAGVPGCLFVTVPDVVGDAQATATLFDTWAPELEARDLPVALVLQDGVDVLEGWLENTWSRLSAVFVGGTDEFKLGPVAAELAREAKARGLHVHWGRVNSRKRMRLIAETGAADSFDGSPWATLRLAAVNQRTIDRALAAGRRAPAAVRKLDQGLAWALELAREAAAAVPAFVEVDGRTLPTIAGGSPELDTPRPPHCDRCGDRYGGCVYCSEGATFDPTAPAPELDDADYVERYRRRHAERVAGLELETRARLADYHVLTAYDLRRAGRYGDMSASRRGRELNRLADALIDAGVPVDRDGEFPASTDDELVAAFERVGRPRLRRLERETAPWTASDGAVYERRTRYNGTSLDAWRAIERRFAGGKGPA